MARAKLRPAILMLTCVAIAAVPAAAGPGATTHPGATRPADPAPLLAAPPAPPTPSGQAVATPTKVRTLILGSANQPSRIAAVARQHPPDVPLAEEGATLRRSAGARVLRAAATSEPFSAVGVTWRDDPAIGVVSVAVRTRRNLQSGWSAWSTVDAEADEGPARGPAMRGGAELVWTGPSRGVEVVVTSLGGVVPGDVRVDLIDPGYRPSDNDPARRRAGGTGGSAVAGLASKANYGNNVVTIRSRADWGADERQMKWPPEYAPSVKAVVVHHTATTNSYSWPQVPAILRSIYRFHAVSRGWGDIGYNVIVDRFGYAWEGRAGGLTKAVIGAHAGGFNTGTSGIAVIGDFRSSQPPAIAVEGLARVIAYKLGTAGVNPRIYTIHTGGPSTRYKQRVTIRIPTVYPHKLTSLTACPGRYLESLLSRVRLRAAYLIYRYRIRP